MLVKVCGLIDKSNVDEITSLDIDMIGLNFYPPSKRYIGNKKENIFENVSDRIDNVGVFVNEEKDKISALIDQYALKYVQLHGSETPKTCIELQEKVKVIKAFGINEGDHIDDMVAEYLACDFLLFDTKTPLHGGSGRKFSWTILESYTGDTPFILSGGIGPDDAAEILKINHSQLKGVDINSKFESSPGIKKIDKVSYFIKNLNG